MGKRLVTSDDRSQELGDGKVERPGETSRTDRLVGASEGAQTDLLHKGNCRPASHRVPVILLFTGHLAGLEVVTLSGVKGLNGTWVESVYLFHRRL